MAKATEEITTEEVVQTVEKKVIVLELSVEEAKVLRDITGSIGGGVNVGKAVNTDARKANDRIYDELSRIFPGRYRENCNPFTTQVKMRDE